MQKQFDSIQGLKWSPWVGENYQNVPDENKVLVIGESHYLSDADESEMKHMDPNWTNVIVDELARRREYGKVPFFRGFHKGFFGHDDFDAVAFWDKISFYNFIQRPMGTKVKRPNKADRIIAWSVFSEVVKVLKPRYCVFLGVTMANYFKAGLKDSGFKLDGIHYIEKIGEFESRGAKIILSPDEEVDLLFIKHPSRAFDYKAWHKYLQRELGQVHEWYME